MPIKWSLRQFFVFALVVGFAVPCWGHQRETRLPLLGCHAYYLAKGTVRYLQKVNEAGVDKYESLTIEISRVPLKPGTTLVVEVDGETVGKIVLDNKQSGSLSIDSVGRKYVPRVLAGTGITIKKSDGTIVIW